MTVEIPLNSKAKSTTDKSVEKAEVKVLKAIDGLSKGSELLGQFAANFPLGDERSEKITKLGELLCTPGLRETYYTGVKSAINDIHEFVDQSDTSKRAEFIEDIHGEMLDAKLAIRKLSKSGTEIEKAAKLIHEVKVLNTKIEHSTSNSKIQKARYHAGQVTTLARSINEQYEVACDGLDSVNVDKLENEIKRLASSKVKIDTYQEALSRIGRDTRDPTAFTAGVNFLKELGEENTQRRDTRAEPTPEAESSRPKDKLGEVPEQGMLQRRTNIPIARAFTKDWVDEAKEYFYGSKTGQGEYAGNGLIKWGADVMTPEQKQRIEAMIKEVDVTSSMKVAVELWKEINVIWLKKTNTISDDFKLDLLDRTSNVRYADDATNVARESLALHMNRQFKEYPEVLKEILDGFEKRYPSIDYTVVFDNVFNKLESNLGRPPQTRNYLGDDQEWEYTYAVAMELYKSGKTKGAGRYPPPPPAPTTQQTGERQDLDDNRNRYPPPPPAPTAQQTGERQDLDDPPHWLK